MSIAPSAATILRPGWLVALVPDGIAIVGPRTEATLAVGAGPSAAHELLANLESDAELRAVLDELGATGAPEPPPADGLPLAAAIAACRAEAPPSGPVWTAEEALVLPHGCPPDVATRAVRAFVAGLQPDGRLRAYALAAAGQGVVHGDRPPRDRLAAALAALDLDDPDIRVVRLDGAGEPWRVAPGELDAIGAHEAHRLGPIQRIDTPEPVADDLPDLHLCTAEIAVASLAVVSATQDRRVQGVGTAAHARLVARAEGAERFAMADPSGEDIMRATAAELDGAIPPHTLYAPAPPAPPAEPDRSPPAPRLWTPAVAHDGSRRWVPAEVVYTSLAAPAAPARTIPWSSSGVAAHPDPTAARRRAFAELIERDAFLVAWRHRTARERIAPRTAGDAPRRFAQALARRGWATHWVNLTLETFPVILCCLVHEEHGLTVGAACDADPARALLRATTEALVLAVRWHGDEPPPAPADVRAPVDHLRLHRDPRRRADHAFLYSSPDEIPLSDVPAAAPDTLESRIRAAGIATLTVDLTSPATQPFHVIRALAPGLLPLTFGAGREPWGMPRARPRPDGEGQAPAGGTVPHPFP